MHYYKRNIGDYAKKAGRLSIMQHGVYTLLMDACYDREQFPTLEQAIEWVWASTTEEIEALKFVLSRFFDLENGVYTQTRIQEEVAEYHAKADTNQRIARERETKRRENSTNRAPVVHEAPPNHKPLTTNQEPITKEPKDKRAVPAAYADLLSDIPKQISDDWIALRKSKKAAVTRTAIEGVILEAGKAGMSLEAALQECCTRGWAGFKASWLDDSLGNRGNPNKQEALESRNRTVADKWADKFAGAL